MVAQKYSLYYHIPFCTKKCDYCHFFVLPDKESDKNVLLNGLRQEFLLRKPFGALASIYFGGGTPSLFGPERIREVISWSSEVGEPSKACEEITLEVNPDGINRPLMEAYREAGVNRISMGVQSLDDDHLIQLGRTHTSSMAEKAVYLIREAGFDNISIDLMYDLPSLDLATWEKTLKKAAKLPIDHLSLYNLTIEPQTVFFKYRQTIEKKMPTPELSLAMYESAQHILEDAGLKQYEISAFAKPSKSSIHNSGYWTGRPFLGLGPSAFSYWDKKRFRNIAHLRKYASFLEETILPVDFEELLSPDSQERELFAIHLRLMDGAPLPSFHKELIPLIEGGLLTLSSTPEQKVRLTQRGILLYDSIASEII